MITNELGTINFIAQKIDNKLFGNIFSSILNKFTNALNEIDIELDSLIFNHNHYKITREQPDVLKNVLNRIGNKYNILQSVESFIKYNVLDLQNYVLFYDSKQLILIDQVDLKIIQQKIIKLEVYINNLCSKLGACNTENDEIKSLFFTDFLSSISKINCFISDKQAILSSIETCHETSEKIVFDLSEVDIDIFQRSLENLFKITKAIEENIDLKKDYTFSSTLKSLMETNKKLIEEVSREIGVDKSYISRLIKGDRKNPARDIVLKLCIALELDLKNTYSLLSSAGYTLEDVNKRDFIIKTFIENSVYSIDKIDETLGNYRQKYLFYDTNPM